MKVLTSAQTVQKVNTLPQHQGSSSSSWSVGVWKQVGVKTQQVGPAAPLGDLLYSCPELSRLIPRAACKSTQGWRHEVQEKNSMLLHLLCLQCYHTFFLFSFFLFFFFFFPPSFTAWSLTSPRATRYCSDSDELFWSVTFCLSADEMLSFPPWLACSN